MSCSIAECRMIQKSDFLPTLQFLPCFFVCVSSNWFLWMFLQTLTLCVIWSRISSQKEKERETSIQFWSGTSNKVHRNQVNLDLIIFKRSFLGNQTNFDLRKQKRAWTSSAWEVSAELSAAPLMTLSTSATLDLKTILCENGSWKASLK